MLPSPIVLPKPCLSESLDPLDFEVATRALFTVTPPALSPTRFATERGRDRPASFDPAKAPWRINRGSFRSESGAIDLLARPAAPVPDLRPSGPIEV